MSLPTDVGIEELGVSDIADGVAQGRLSPVDIVEAAIERIEALDGKIEAWSFLDVSGAREQARTLAAEAKAGKLRGPLHGVPFGVKDEFHVKGMPTRMRNLDSPPREPEDAACVALLRDAGAIVLGKTYMPVGGRPMPTKNPWNIERTPGATSSGSGAAVGAHMIPMAIGEQTAGSNLRPASFCGVAALKPTYGRISRYGCMPFAWSLDHVGIMAQSMADVALVLSVIAGPDPRDPTSLQVPPPLADLRLGEFSPPRIGVVRNFFLEGAEPAMRDAVELAKGQLAEAGARVEELMLPEEFSLSWQIHRLIGASEGSTIHAVDHADPEVKESHMSGSGGRGGSLVPADYYVQARRIRSWLRTKLSEEVFGDFDAVLMPAAPGPAPLLGAGRGNSSDLVCWSVMGFPAINLPCGLSPDGLPLGLQLVAGPVADYELLRVGAWCEGVLGRLPVPPLP